MTRTAGQPARCFSPKGKDVDEYRLEDLKGKGNVPKEAGSLLLLREAVPVIPIYLAFCLIFPGLAAGDVREVATLETRAGVTLRLLLVTPEGPAKGAFVMLEGGEGVINLGLDGEIGGPVRQGFLVRSANRFVEKGFAVAIMAVPSDMAGGLREWDRLSDQHVADIKKVIDFLQGRGLSLIFLLGMSKGTLSVANFAAPLKDHRIAGIVLAASAARTWVSPPRPPIPDLSSLPLERVTVPVLFVHHRDDGCSGASFSSAIQQRRRITQSPRSDFLEVRGGDPPRSLPCFALSAHGFLGKEPEVVQAITDWVLERPVPSIIGP